MKASFLLLLYLHSKRLLRRVSFWLILALIPVLCLSLAHGAREEAGMLCVALAAEDPADPVAAAAIERLSEQGGVVRYRITTPALARQWVREGSADAAWIFSEESAEALEAFARGGRRPFVEVLQREESSRLKLAREQLFSALYPSLSYETYRAFLLSRFPDGPEESMQRYYDLALPMEEILVMESMDGRPVAVQGNHLTLVLRGLMSLVVVMAGAAGAVFAAEDHARGVFFAFSPRRRALVSLSAAVSAAGIAAAVMALSLGLSGLPGAPWWQEGLSLVLFVWASAGFAVVYTALLPHPRMAAAALPLAAAVLTVFSPVFFPAAPLGLPFTLLPTHCYLYAAADAGAFLPLFLYALAAPAAGCALFCLRERRT